MYPELDPAIAAALMARQRRYGQGFEGPLPAPGGPVDIGIDQAARERGGMGAGMNTQDQFMALLQLLNRPRQNEKPMPGQRRMQAVENAHNNIIERVQRLQHQRRANGPYPG